MNIFVKKDNIFLYYVHLHLNSKKMNFSDEIKKASDILYQGGVILYPTDTIWGIGCDATNEEAVRRVYEIKHREDSKSMLVLLDSSSKLNFYVENLPDIAIDLVDLSDKPLTIIYPGAQNLAKNLVADDGSIGIRITNEKFSKELCNRFRKAIVSTSANISGQPSPANFLEISKELIESVDYVVNYRQDDLTSGKPSGIIKLDEKGRIKIIRE